MPRRNKKDSHLRFTEEEKDLIGWFLGYAKIQAISGMESAEKMLLLAPELAMNQGMIAYWKSIQQALDWCAARLEYKQPWLPGFRVRNVPKEEAPCPPPR